MNSNILADFCITVLYYILIVFKYYIILDHKAKTLQDLKTIEMFILLQ